MPPPPKAQLYVAIALLIGFAVVVGYMFYAAGEDGDTWERRIYIFSGVEAIVFTAVGWLFGREVHRATAEAAQQDATEAKQETKAARAKADEEVQKSQQLVGAIAVLPGEAAAPTGGGFEDVSPPRAGAAPAAHVTALKALAQKLYG